MDQEFHRAGGLAHRDSDVLDLHVLLELQDQRRLLLGGQLLDQGPDPAELVAMSSKVLEGRSRNREVVEVVERLRRLERAVAIRAGNAESLLPVRESRCAASAPLASAVPPRATAKSRK